jgi:hypothetical protein
MTKLQQVNKIVIKMLNKHEIRVKPQKSKRQKQKTKRMYDEHIKHGCTKTLIIRIVAAAAAAGDFFH